MKSQTNFFGFLSIAAVLFVAGGPASLAQPVLYTVENIGTLPGGRSSFATGINNARQIVGVSENANGILHGFVWTPGEGMRDIGALGSAANAPFVRSRANAINGAGLVVGQSGDTSSSAIVVRNGAMSALPSYYAGQFSESYAFAVNAAGHIVGSAQSLTPRQFLGGYSVGPPHAFVHRGSLLVDLGTINDTAGQSAAYGINDSGDIVGQSATPGGFGFDHAFLYANGRMTDLGTLSGFQESAAGAINNAGQIVGYVRTNSFTFPTTRGFLYTSGTMRDIGTLPGANYTLPLAINNAGVVAGTANDRSGRPSAFTYTPAGGMVDISNRGAVIVSVGSVSSPSGAYIGVSQAVGISDFGVIAAVAQYAGGVTRAFVLMPQNVFPARIARQPAPQTVVIGGAATFSVSLAPDSEGRAGAFLYQWRKDGQPLAGATNATLTISNVQSASVGGYDVVVTGGFNTVTSERATLTLGEAAVAGRLVNLSIRSNAGAGDSTLIVGFVIGGAGTSGSKPILARGIGPALAEFGVTGVLADPVMTVMSGSATVATNDNWGGAAPLVSASAQVGAFALANAGGRDAAILSPAMAAGSYTIQIAGNGGGTGVALAEVYDATASNSFTATTPRLVNVSARTQVGTGANILITGFVIGGQSSRTVLIRAIGPALAQFGVGGTLADPQLRLFDSGARQLAENNDWSDDGALAAAFTRVGAFGLATSSRDAVLLMTLAPGSYTAQISGVNNTTGVALVEVYEVP